MKLKVNPRLLPIKAHYFLHFAGVAPILPYMAVYAKQLGFDEWGVGLMFLVLPFMGMVAKPLAGWLADRFHLHKPVFMASILFSGVFYFALLLIPDIQQDNSSHLQCTEPESVVKICRDAGSMQTLLASLHTNPPRCSMTCSLHCTLKDETIMRSICSAFDYSLHGCYEDTTPLDLTELDIIIYSNITVHDTQPNPSCLLLPIDTVHHGNETRDHLFCSTHIELDCQAVCEDEEVRRFVRQDSVFAAASSWFFFLCNIFAFSAVAVTSSMGDAVCFTVLEGKNENYGAQRVWGSLGWGSFTVLGGYLVDSYSHNLPHGHKDYTPAMYLMAGLLVLDLLCCQRLQLAPPQTSAAAAVGPRRPKAGDLWRLVAIPRVAVFVVWCTLVGVLTSLVWQWLPWYLTDLAGAVAHNQDCDSEDHGASWLTLLLGLNMGIQCFVGEVPMFFLSGWIIKKLGHVNTMSLVLGAFGVRFLAYSLLTSPWFSLPIEILNGVTFGIFYATMASYAHIISPPGLGSTVQGLVGGVFEGAGVAVGSLLGGAVYKSLGGSQMFRWFGVAALSSCLLHALLQHLLTRKGQDIKQQPPTSYSVVATILETEKPILREEIGKLREGGEDLALIPNQEESALHSTTPL